MRGGGLGIGITDAESFRKSVTRVSGKEVLHGLGGELSNTNVYPIGMSSPFNMPSPLVCISLNIPV